MARRDNPIPPIKDRVDHVADDVWRYRGWLIDLRPSRQGGFSASLEAEDPKLVQQLQGAGLSRTRALRDTYRSKTTAMASAMSSVVHAERTIAGDRALQAADVLVQDVVGTIQWRGGELTRAEVARKVQELAGDKYQWQKVNAFNSLPMPERLALIDFTIELAKDRIP